MALISGGGAGLPNPITTPVNIDPADVSVFAETFDFTGEDNWEGAIRVLVKDVDTLTGDGYVIRVVDVNGDQVWDIDAYGSLSINARGSGTGGIQIIGTAGGFNATTDGTVAIQGATAGSALGVVNAFGANGNANLGFFTKAATPVAQPAAPVTLADVIAALKTLGLVAT